MDDDDETVVNASGTLEVNKQLARQHLKQATGLDISGSPQFIALFEENKRKDRIDTVQFNVEGKDGIELQSIVGELNSFVMQNQTTFIGYTFLFTYNDEQLGIRITGKPSGSPIYINNVINFLELLGKELERQNKTIDETVQAHEEEITISGAGMTQIAAEQGFQRLYVTHYPDKANPISQIQIATISGQSYVALVLSNNAELSVDNLADILKIEPSSIDTRFHPNDNNTTLFILNDFSKATDLSLHIGELLKEQRRSHTSTATQRNGEPDLPGF